MKNSDRVQIVNESVDFVIRKWTSIKPLLSCIEEAKAEIPSWLTKRLSSEITSQLSIYSKDEWKKYDYDDYLNFFPLTYYNERKELGIYFGVEGLSFNKLNAEVDDEGPIIYACADIPRLGAQRNRVLANLQNHRSRVQKKLNSKYFIIPPQEWDKKNWTYLFWRPLRPQLDLDALSYDPESAIRAAAKSVVQFIEPIVPTLKEMKCFWN